MNESQMPASVPAQSAKEAPQRGAGTAKSPEYHDGLPMLPPAEAAKVIDKLRIQIIGVRAGWSAWAARETDVAAATGSTGAAGERWRHLMGVDAPLRGAETWLESALAALDGITEKRCVCGPDSTGEAPDERPDCPVHGVNGSAQAQTSDSEEAPF